MATEGENNETSLIIPNFNYFLTQTSYLQDSNWSGIVSIILIEKMYIVFKDNAVKKSVGMGQSLMIINVFSSKDFYQLFYYILKSELVCFQHCRTTSAF